MADVGRRRTEPFGTEGAERFELQRWEVNTDELLATMPSRVSSADDFEVLPEDDSSGAANASGEQRILPNPDL